VDFPPTRFFRASAGIRFGFRALETNNPRHKHGGAGTMALRVGVVGIRGIGNRHADCHAADSLSELVAVCDVVKERADEAAEKHGIPAYYSLRDMLAAEDLDIVDVTTGGNENGGWHFEPVMEALDAGKHVLVEKPISNQVSEAREMVAFAARKDLYLGCNLNHYFTEPAEQARRLMDENRIGELVYCLHRMGFAGGEFTYKPGGGNPNADGFPYFHVKAFLAHPFSIMRYFCGNITHIQAFMTKPSFRRAAGDPMLSVNSIHVRFENDSVGYLFSQRGDATMGLGGWWSVEVGGTRGTFCIENCVEKLTYFPVPGTEGAAQPENLGLGQAPKPEVTNTGVTDFSATFPRRIHAFLEDVTNGVPKHKLRASGRDALATLEYTFAAIESFESGGALVRPRALPPIVRSPRG
jgi:predicted dehydrogenase